MPPFRQLPGRAKVFVVAAIAASLAAVAVGWAVQPVRADQIGLLLYLAVGTQVAALLPIKWPYGVQTVVDPLLIATGLYAPGGGVGLVAWIATFDRRVPGRDTTWSTLLFNRAMLGIAHVLPSMAVAMIAPREWWNLPVKTGLYVVAWVAINYLMAARALSFANRTPFWSTLAQNVAGISTLRSTVVLGFSGGIISLVLAQGPVGYLMAPALFGFILAVRDNVADAQTQREQSVQTLALLAQALDQRDPYTEEHSKHVAEWSGRLAEYLGLDAQDCDQLRRAGALHDLGKIGVRDVLLNKEGPLTDDEWETMRKHPDIGADMIERHSALKELAPLVRHHHERWDGSGYPKGLKADAIPFGARILSVADSFDTITGVRLYRRSVMTPLEGVEDISRRAGHWYDPNVVDALRALHGIAPLDLADRPEVPRRITNWNVLKSNPGFARLLAAMSVSALGDQLTLVAALVSVYAATHGDSRAVAAAFIAQAVATVVMSGAFGGIADRFARKQLVVYLDLTRAALLIATPFLVPLSIWMIVPILFVLAAINSIVAPARQAAVPGLVGQGQVGKATAMYTQMMTACSAIGFGVAGALLALAQQLGFGQHATTILFIGDAMTFAAAAALVVGIRSLGGGAETTRVTGAWRRAWSVEAVRPHLAIAATAVFLLSMSYPALVALAYRLQPKAGGPTYSVLEVVLSAGLFIGSVMVSRSQSIGTLRTAGAGLLVTGVFSLAITLTTQIYVVAAAIFVASLGNAIYYVANQTAVAESADPSNRGSVMATRFSLVQTASIGGTAVGGFVTQAYGANGPLVAYGVLAIGLILLGMFALAAGRRTTSSLTGPEYEAALMAAGAHQAE